MFDSKNRVIALTAAACQNDHGRRISVRFHGVTGYHYSDFRKGESIPTQNFKTKKVTSPNTFPVFGKLNSSPSFGLILEVELFTHPDFFDLILVARAGSVVRPRG